MTKVYIVAGDNGSGNSGHVVLGMYPTEELAQKRQKFAEAEGMAEFVYYEEFQVGADGADFEFYVEG